MEKYNIVINKILQYKTQNIYLVFYSKWCRYSMSAIKLLKSNDIQYKKYNLDTFEGGLEHVLDCLIEYKDVVNFDPKHKTRPLVFYKGKFIGGFRELKETL